MTDRVWVLIVGEEFEREGYPTAAFGHEPSADEVNSVRKQTFPHAEGTLCAQSEADRLGNDVGDDVRYWDDGGENFAVARCLHVQVQVQNDPLAEIAEGGDALIEMQVQSQ